MGDGVMDDETWLTYGELGEQLGISVATARAMSRRHNWPRRTPNEHGALARVLVPADLSTIRPRPPAGRSMNGVRLGDGRDTENGAGHPAEPPAVSRTLALLTAQLVRADRAEQRADQERDRADALQTALTADKLELNRRLDQAEAKAAGLQARIDELQTALSEERRRVIEILTRPWWRRWFR
jgi:hypothetical protein